MPAGVPPVKEEASVEALAATNAMYHQMLEACAEENAVAARAAANARQSMEIAHSKLAEVERERDAAVHELQTTVANRIVAREQRHALGEEERTELQKHVAAMAEQLQESKTASAKHLADLVAENESLQKKLFRAAAALERVPRVVTQHENEIRRVARARIAYMASALELREKSVAEATEDIAQLRGLLAESEAARASAAADRATADAAGAALLAEKDAQVAALQAELQASRHAASSLQARENDVIAKVEQAAAQRLEQSTTAFAQRTGELSTELRGVQNENALLRTKMAELEAVLEERTVQLTAKVSAAENAMSSARADAAAAQVALVEATAAHNGLLRETQATAASRVAAAQALASSCANEAAAAKKAEAAALIAKAEAEKSRDTALAAVAEKAVPEAVVLSALPVTLLDAAIPEPATIFAALPPGVEADKARAAGEAASAAALAKVQATCEQKLLLHQTQRKKDAELSLAHLKEMEQLISRNATQVRHVQELQAKLDRAEAALAEAEQRLSVATVPQHTPAKASPAGRASKRHR